MVPAPLPIGKILSGLILKYRHVHVVEVGTFNASSLIGAGFDAQGNNCFRDFIVQGDAEMEGLAL